MVIETNKKAGTFISLLLIGSIFLFVISSVFIFLSLEKEQTELAEKIDHRFKSYDAFFVLTYSDRCINATKEDVAEYFVGRETPLSDKLIEGEWLCNK